MHSFAITIPYYYLLVTYTTKEGKILLFKFISKIIGYMYIRIDFDFIFYFERVEHTILFVVL
jgi:hypothetical protein